MYKFKEGDIVIATGIEISSHHNGELFKVFDCFTADTIGVSLYLHMNNERWFYFNYKFKKATRKQIKQCKFRYMVEKLKGVNFDGLEKII